MVVMVVVVMMMLMMTDGSNSDYSSCISCNSRKSWET
jgi:hypothetical protein